MYFFLIFAEADHITALSDRFHSQAKALQFFDEDSEGSWDAWFFDGLTFDDRLISVNTSLYIIRFDSEHFLKRISSSISLERPNFHFTESLTAKLRLAAERLLRYQ